MIKMLFTLTVVSILWGCTANPEDLIVGKWTFDHLSAKEGDTTATGDNLTIQEKEQVIKDNNAYFIFHKDKTCTIGGQGLEENGTYEISGSSLQILLGPHERDYVEVIDISKTELCLSFNSSRFPEELVHLKKSK